VEAIDTYVKRYRIGEFVSSELLGALSVHEWSKGEFLIRAGDPVERLYFFVEGRAKVYGSMENGSSLLVRFYSPFDILGDVELFSFERYILNVEALGPTVCLGLGVDAIKRSADRNGPFFMYLCGRLGRKLASFNTSASINMRYPVENRLASYLLALESGEGESGLCLGTEDLGELADILGSSYRQLSRVVRRFRDEGILESRRGRLRVLAPEKLEDLARDLYI
jgi:CRP-like cAMP-binding protein